MIVGMGSDVVEMERVRAALERQGERFLQRVLSAAERQTAQGLTGARRTEFVAGRFAAKEAMAKATGTGLGRLGMTRVDIQVGASGLEVTTPLYPDETFRWHVSISHERHIVFAVAILERL
ncbi:MAG: holo-ACP synthase [Alicyclobacillus sp.]|nr:holo-ACP synthase [Alicyclobacillus sp.]